MLGQLAAVFLEVVAPVFAIVALGYLAGPRLAIEARSLSRTAYWVFVPAFTFDVISRTGVPFGRAGRIAAFIVATHAVFAALGWAIARLLGRSREVTAAYVMLAVFGNVGNYGLALLRFRLGDEALLPATIYYVVSTVLSFTTCVAVASAVRGGGGAAALSVLKTPSLHAALAAVTVSALGLELPLPVARTAGLLGGAMIPTMLFTLGLQLAATGIVRPTADVLASAGLRLFVAPAVAAIAAVPFGLAGVDRAACILQAAMPAAVLVAIISSEYDVAPPFVMATVFYSTLASLPVLTVLLAIV
jgi:predicted permease